MESKNDFDGFDVFTVDELLKELNNKSNQEKKEAKAGNPNLNDIIRFYQNQPEPAPKKGAKKFASFLNKEGLKVVESGSSQKNPAQKGTFFKLADYVDKQSVGYALKNSAIVGGAVAIGKIAADSALSSGLIESASTAAYIAPGVMLTVGAVRGVLDLRKELKEKKDNKILSDLAKHEISNRKFPNIKETRLINTLREEASKRGLDKAITEKLEPFLAKGLDESKLPTEFIDKQGSFRPWVKFASRVALHASILGASAIAGPVAGVAVAGAVMLHKSGVLDKVYKMVTGKETKRAEEKRLALESLSPEERAAQKKKTIGNTILALGTTTAACILGGKLGEQFDVGETLSNKATEMGNALKFSETVDNTQEAFKNVDSQIVSEPSQVVNDVPQAVDTARGVITDAPVSIEEAAAGFYADTTVTLTEHLGENYFEHSQNNVYTMNNIRLENFNPNNPNDVIRLMINDRETFNQIVEGQKFMNEVTENMPIARSTATLEDVAGEAIAREASVILKTNPDFSEKEALGLAIDHRIALHTASTETAGNAITNTSEISNVGTETARNVQAEQPSVEPQVSATEKVRSANNSVRDAANQTTERARDISGRVGAAERINRDWGLSDKAGETLEGAKDTANKVARTGTAVNETAGGVNRTTEGIEKMQEGDIVNGSRRVAEGVDQTARGVDRTIRTVTGENSEAARKISGLAERSGKTISNLNRIFGKGR